MPQPLYEFYAWPGGLSDAITHLRRSIPAFCRSDREVNAYYIGIASGVHFENALARRFDDYKRDAGVNRMICIYYTSSESFCRQVEAHLVKEFGSVSV